jgi:membrane protease YdiL (CAAX protease family)
VVLSATLVLGYWLLKLTEWLFPGWPEIVRLALPTEISFAAAIAFVVWRGNCGWRESLSIRALDRRSIPPLLLVLVGSVTVFSELYVVIQRLAPVPEAYAEFLRGLLDTGSPEAIVLAVILAPLLEEALFRGAVLQGLSRTRGPRSASTWTAIFFTVFHIYNPWQLLPTFFLGLVLAWLVLTTGSLWASVAVHGLFNAVSLLLIRLPAEDISPSQWAVPWVVSAIVLALLAGSLALLVGMAWIERQTGGGPFAESETDLSGSPPRGTSYLPDASS